MPALPGRDALARGDPFHREGTSPVDYLNKSFSGYTSPCWLYFSVFSVYVPADGPGDQHVEALAGRQDEVIGAHVPHRVAVLGDDGTARSCELTSYQMSAPMFASRHS